MASVTRGLGLDGSLGKGTELGTIGLDFARLVIGLVPFVLAGRLKAYKYGFRPFSTGRKWGKCNHEAPAGQE